MFEAYLEAQAAIDQDMDIEALTVKYLLALDVQAGIAKTVGRLAQMITRDLEARGATRTPCADGGYLQLEFPSPQYNQVTLDRLFELNVPPQDILKEGYTPAEMKEVPAKWNMTKVKAWGNQYGAPVQDVIDSAKLEPKTGPQLKRVLPKN